MKDDQAFSNAPNDAQADDAWKKIMVLAERYALVVQAYGGSATLATPAAQRDAGIRNKCLRMVRFREEEKLETRSRRSIDIMAKTKKNRKRSKPSDGDELIDDANAPVAVAPKAKAKAGTKKQKAAGRKTGPASSKKAKKTSAKAKAKAPSGKRLRVSVEHKAPKAGSKFTAKYKGKTYTMTVKKAKDGGVVYVVRGKSYKSPSSAARSVLDAGQKNGWTFWGIE